MNAVTLKVEGMRCEGCAANIQALLGKSTDVQRAAASFNDGEVRILFDRRAISEEQLIAVIEKAGYRVAGGSKG